MTNKHVLAALIVAPLLAALAWVGADRVAGEQPAAAVRGMSYRLSEGSDCRYQSGHCTLQNGDFKLVIVLEQRGADTWLVLDSDYSLQGVMMSVAYPGRTPSPSAMVATTRQSMVWTLRLDSRPVPPQRLYFVASRAGVKYFGDVATVFTEPSRR